MVAARVVVTAARVVVVGEVLPRVVVGCGFVDPPHVYGLGPGMT